MKCCPFVKAPGVYNTVWCTHMCYTHLQRGTFTKHLSIGMCWCLLSFIWGKNDKKLWNKLQMRLYFFDMLFCWHVSQWAVCCSDYQTKSLTFLSGSSFRTSHVLKSQPDCKHVCVSCWWDLKSISLTPWGSRVGQRKSLVSRRKASKQVWALGGHSGSCRPLVHLLRGDVVIQQRLAVLKCRRIGKATDKVRIRMRVRWVGS